MTTQEQAAGFEPARYLTKLSRRAKTADGQWKTFELDYMEVKYRVLWLRHEHPEAVIHTTIHTLDDHLCVVQAAVSIPGGGMATGIGSETPDDWKDYIEKAETKAVGRALAALGFGTAFCQDFDFGEGDPDRVVDAPAQRPKAVSASPPISGGPSPTRTPTYSPVRSGSSSAPNVGGAPAGGWQDRPATEPQIKAIYAIARGTQAMDDGTLAEWCTRRFGEPLERLSRRQASEAIDSLKLGVSS